MKTNVALKCSGLLLWLGCFNKGRKRMKIGFNDSYKSDGFVEGIEFINKLLKPYHLKIKETFIDEEDGTEDFVWEIKVEKVNEKN